MNDQVVYTEIVLAELAQLVDAAGGDRHYLDAALDLHAYFTRDDVVGVGRDVQEHRRRDLDDDARAKLDRYFGAIGDFLASQPAATTVQVAPARTVIYFQGPGDDREHLELVLVEGRALLAVRQGSVDCESVADAQVLSYYRPGLGRRFIAFSPGGAVAHSDDGTLWRCDEHTPNRERRDVLREHFGTAGG